MIIIMGKLPKRYRQFQSEFPALGSAYEAYGAEAATAGPLDERTRCLVKLAISLAARLEGGAKSHAHKALDAGVTPEEIRHVAILLGPTVGFPSMMAALGWVDEVLEHGR